MFGTGELAGLYGGAAKGYNRRRGGGMPWWQQTLLVAAAQPVVGAISEGVSEIGKGIFLGGDRDFFETAHGKQAARRMREGAGVKDLYSKRAQALGGNQVSTAKKEIIASQKAALDLRFEGSPNKDSLVSAYIIENDKAFTQQAKEYVDQFNKMHTIVKRAPTLEELEIQLESAPWYGESNWKKFTTRIGAALDPDKTVDDYKRSGIKWALYGDDAHKYSDEQMDDWLSGDTGDKVEAWLRGAGTSVEGEAIDELIRDFGNKNPAFRGAYEKAFKIRAENIGMGAFGNQVTPETASPSFIAWWENHKGKDSSNAYAAQQAYFRHIFPKEEDKYTNALNYYYAQDPQNLEGLKNLREFFVRQRAFDDDPESFADLTTKQNKVVMEDVNKFLKSLATTQFRESVTQAADEVSRETGVVLSGFGMDQTYSLMEDFFNDTLSNNLKYTTPGEGEERKGVVDAMMTGRWHPSDMWSYIISQNINFDDEVGGFVGIKDRRAGVDFLKSRLMEMVEDPNIGTINFRNINESSAGPVTQQVLMNNNKADGYLNMGIFGPAAEEKMIAAQNEAFDAGNIPAGEEMNAKSDFLDKEIKELYTAQLKEAEDKRYFSLHINQKSAMKAMEIRMAHAVGLPTGKNIETTMDRLHGEILPVPNEVWESLEDVATVTEVTEEKATGVMDKAFSEKGVDIDTVWTSPLQRAEQRRMERISAMHKDLFTSDATTRVGKLADYTQKWITLPIKEASLHLYDPIVSLTAAATEEIKTQFTSLWDWSTENIRNEDVGHLLRANQIHITTELKAQYPNRIDEIDRASRQLLTAQPDIETSKFKQGLANLVFGDLERKNYRGGGTVLAFQKPENSLLSRPTL